MSNIGNYNKTQQNPVSYARKENYTDRVQQFVKYLHDFMPIIEQEFDDLEKKAQTKPCKAFDDKMAGLSAIFNAEKQLHYWYVENVKRQV